MAQTIIADPDGDTLLLLEPEERDGIGPPAYKRFILCSSRHLALASPIFKTILKNAFSGDTRLLKTGQFEIPLPEDDSTIMTTLVLLIHGRHYHPDIKMLIQLEFIKQAAVTVDKYKMLESVDWTTRRWAYERLRVHEIYFHRASKFPIYNLHSLGL